MTAELVNKGSEEDRNSLERYRGSTMLMRLGIQLLILQSLLG